MLIITTEAMDQFEYEFEFDPANATETVPDPVYVYLRREGDKLLALGHNAEGPVTDPAVIAAWCGVTVEELPGHLDARYTEAWRESAENYFCESPY